MRGNLKIILILILINIIGLIDWAGALSSEDFNIKLENSFLSTIDSVNDFSYTSKLKFILLSERENVKAKFDFSINKNLTSLDPLIFYREDSQIYNLITQFENQILDYGLSFFTLDTSFIYYNMNYFNSLYDINFIYPTSSICLNEAYIKILFSSSDLSFGILKLGWGTTYFFHSTSYFDFKENKDIELNNISQTKPMFRLKLYINEYFTIDNVFIFDKNRINSSWGSRIIFNSSKLLTSFYLIRENSTLRKILGLSKEYKLGNDGSFQIKNIGINYEISYNLPHNDPLEFNDSLNYFQWVISSNYTFNNGIYIVGEYYYNGLGNKSGVYDIYDLINQYMQREMFLSQRYGLLGIKKDFNESFSVFAGNIVNIIDKTSLLIGNLNYTYNDYLDFSINLMYPFKVSSSKGEFYSLKPMMSLTMNYWF